MDTHGTVLEADTFLKSCSFRNRRFQLIFVAIILLLRAKTIVNDMPVTNDSQV